MRKHTALLASVAVVLTIAIGVFAALPNGVDGAIKVNINMHDRSGLRTTDLFHRFCVRIHGGFVFGFCPVNGNTNTNNNTNINQNSNTNTNTNSNVNVNGNTNQNSNTNTNQNSNTNVNTNTNTNGNTNSGGENPPPTGAVLLSEAFGSGTNNLEWLEIYNGMNVSVDFSGWFISDSATTTPDKVPTTTPIIPGGFLILTATSSPSYLEPLPAGVTKMYIGNTTIGGGLNGPGDEVHLYDASMAEVDAMSYGTDKNVFDPSVPVASPSTHSYYRTSLTADTNTAADWGAHAPNPGVGM